ncbi:PHP domain-containing protein [Candidatus Daviesbacteria bacterium]|nr:PHP domain-containing protein [Candidatus Daviesbacteria bacterium]
METSNAAVAKILRSVAAALTLKKANPFEIQAYENAADAIEHSTSEVKDLWEEGKLDQIPGIGKKLEDHLNELFKTGKVKHFETIKKGFPPILFELLDVPGIGPKSAQELVKRGVRSLDDLNDEGLVKKGISEKVAQKLTASLGEVEGRNTGRMLLPYAFAQAARILAYLKKSPDVLAADPLGSLRRMVSTVGDLDFSVSSKNPLRVVDYFIKVPRVERVIDKGDNKATVVLASGLHVDLLVGEPESYGALLQHFTGSKNHNIKLRTYAEKKGLSLSEYGIKKIKGNKLIPCSTEDQLYKILGMETPEPELREDAGEIEAALRQAQGKLPGLPKLVTLDDIKGDFHLHSSFPIEPSHDAGLDSIEEIIKKARELGYVYLGISDHSPATGTHTKEQIIKLIEKRTKFIQNLNKGKESVRVLNGLEIDILPDGSLSEPYEELDTCDYCIAGVHSVHNMSKDQMTQRLLKALANPQVDILAHPTNRLINGRGSSEVNWEEIFEFCAKNHKLLEINSSPQRLDLPDALVRQALEFGVKFIINTDAHQVAAMDDIRFGVAVARRGWAEEKDIVNTWEWKKIKEWFKIKQ